MSRIKRFIKPWTPSLRRFGARKPMPANFRGILRLASAACLVLAVLLGTLLGGQPAGAGARTPFSALLPAGSALGADARPSRPTLADFAWLEGKWRGDWGPRVAEQVWMPPRAGAMEGLMRVAEGEKTLVAELFSIVEESGGVEFHLRHFTPSLAPWETSAPAILKLTAVDSKKADFENPQNGEPKRIIFRRLDADTYVSHSEIVPEKGEPEVIEIIYHRQK
jgi:hypothetical protein